MPNSRLRVSLEIGLLSLLILVFVVALVNTKNLSSDGRMFPLVVTIGGLPILIAAMAQTLWRAHKGLPAPGEDREVWGTADEAESEADADAPSVAVVPPGPDQTDRESLAVVPPGPDQTSRAVTAVEAPPAPAEAEQVVPTIWRSVRFWVWFAAFCGALWGFGFYVGVPVVAGLYVLVDARKAWWKALLTGVVTWLFLYGVFTEGFGILWPVGYFLQ
jgi:hypothetical protein